jgi:HEAT repeat protein
MMRDFNGLAKSLKSKNPHVRAFTVGVVRYVGWRIAFDKHETLDAPIDNRSVQLLIPMLKDRDEEVRKAAAESLELETKRADVAQALTEYQASLGVQE